MNLFPVYLSIGASLSTLAGGLFVVRLRNRFGLITAFAAGALIAIPFFDLLPESLKLAIKLGLPIDSIMYVTTLGFILIFVLGGISRSIEFVRAAPAKIYAILKEG
jgi:zinc transporter ZupT